MKLGVQGSGIALVLLTLSEAAVSFVVYLAASSVFRSSGLWAALGVLAVYVVGQFLRQLGRGFEESE